MRYGLAILTALSAASCSDDTEPLSESLVVGASGVIDPNFRTVDDFEHGSFSCDNTSSFIFPVLPDEAGHFAASRFESTADVELCSIRYQLSGPATNAPVECESYLEHEVWVFKSDSGEPDAEPELIETFTVAGGEQLDERSRIVSLDIPNGLPITRLQPGEYLFIAVQMAASGTTASLCISACGSPTPDPNVSWWSNAAEPPFNWARLSDFGIENYYNFVLDVRPYDSANSAPCEGR
jgi:hypothetical protein